MTRFGWLPDREPHLDTPIHHLLGAAPPPPPAFDLRDTRALADAYDQTNNDCTANATAGALQILHTPVGALTYGPMFSRRFLYFEGGVPDGFQLADDGRYPGSVIDAASMLGCPAEGVWPYSAPFDKHPGGEAFRQAYDFKLGKYRVPTGDAFRDGASRALANGLPVILGSDVTTGWENQDGVTPFDEAPGAAVVGGHCYLAIGYDLSGLRFRNSWGPWANGGYGYLSWAWCATKITDALVLTLEAA